MTIVRLLLRRLVLGVVTLWLVSVIIFVATFVLPGDAANAILGSFATPQRVAALDRQLHLNEAVMTQYGHWLSGLVRGNLGRSLVNQQSVTSLLSGRVENSGVLVLVAALVALPLSVALGVVAAVRRDRRVDHVFSILSLVFAALPEFVIAISLILLFATSVFHILPAVSLVPPGTGAWRQPMILVLPALTLILAVTPYISRIMRGSMIEVLESEYVQMARLKGLPERVVIWRHAVPNALGPAIQVSALALAWMAGGVIVVENVFGYPGIGSALLDAVDSRDVPVVQAVTLLIALFYVVVNALADTLSMLIVPRLRTGSAR